MESTSAHKYLIENWHRRMIDWKWGKKSLFSSDLETSERYVDFSWRKQQQQKLIKKSSAE